MLREERMTVILKEVWYSGRKIYCLHPLVMCMQYMQWYLQKTSHATDDPILMEQ